MLSGNASSAIVADSIGVDDPLAGKREVIWTDDENTFAGRTTVGGAGFSGLYRHTEMLIVRTGVVRVIAGGQANELTPGHAAVIPAGAEVEIEGSENASWFFYAALQTSAASNEPRLPVFMTGYEDLQPSPPPAADVLKTSTPVCGVLEGISDTGTGSRYGVWAATPYARDVQIHKGHELMYVIEGGMTLSDGNGLSLKLEPGDTVFVPKGSPCGWESTVSMRKFYAGT